MTNKEPDEPGNPMIGIFRGLPIGCLMWIVIIVCGYGIYLMLR